jgi:excisionase family DNA binding protein
VADAAPLVVLSAAELAAVVKRAVGEALDARPQNDVREVLTREQAAELLQVHPSVVVRYVRRDGLPGHKLGAEWRFRRSELLRWLDGRKGAL